MTPVWTATLIAGYALAFRGLTLAARKLEAVEQREQLAEEILLQALAVDAQVERERKRWAEVCELERLFLEDEQ